MNKQERTVLIAAMLMMLFCFIASINGDAAANKMMAQKVIEDIKAAHPDLASVELNAVRSEKEGCATIAATESKEIGEKCDTEDLLVLKTNQTFVEREKDCFDLTVPLLDSSGKVMATVGLDFKSRKGQNKSAVRTQGERIASELRKKFKSREQLFESVE